MTGLNAEQKLVGREQDSGETEGVRDRVLLQMSDGVSNKIGC
jgi:hypothetical protein